MKLERVTIRMGETIPTAQFANVRPEIELSFAIDGTSDFDGAMAHARGMTNVYFTALKNQMLGIRERPVTTQPVAMPQVPPPPTNNIPKVDPATW